MSIRARIVVAVSFQEVDHAPDPETGPDGGHEGLEDADRGSEKAHGSFRNPNPRNALLCRFSAIQREPKHDLYVVLSFCMHISGVGFLSFL